MQHAEQTSATQVYPKREFGGKASNRWAIFVICSKKKLPFEL